MAERICRDYDRGLPAAGRLKEIGCDHGIVKQAAEVLYWLLTVKSNKFYFKYIKKNGGDRAGLRKIVRARLWTLAH
jgi:hypothetical protein